MNKILLPLLFIAMSSFAADVQILLPTGADFSADAPAVVSTIVRSAVQETGNTPVESPSNLQIRTSLMTLGNSIVVVCEQLDNGAIVGSGKEKAASINDIDFAIEAAVKKAFSAPSQNSNSSVKETQVMVVVADEKEDAQVTNEKDSFVNKTPTRNYNSYGLGVAFWHNWGDAVIDSSTNKKSDRDFAVSYSFRWARVWEATSVGAIILQNYLNFSFDDEFQLHEVMLIGGRYYFSTDAIAPYIGAEFGLGYQIDEHYDSDHDGWAAYGFAAGFDAGVVFFRTSSVQLEFGMHYDLMWDGFKSISQNYGAGTAYLAVNY